MIDLNDIKLNNYESDDIFDVVVKLEKSFGIKFSKTAFINVKTFGDLCDIIEEHIHFETREDCTKQQAFYKIRKAISATQFINENQIKLDSNLTDLFPLHNRRQKAREFQNQLGLKINILTYPAWLAFTFVIGLILTFIAFFFDWKVAISGIVFFILATKIAEKLGRNLDPETVRQLTEKVTRERYVEIRRSGQTVNRKEILEIIKDTFSNDLAIDKTFLTRDAQFSW